MRKLFYVLLIGVVMIFGLTFVYYNHELVTISYGPDSWGLSWAGQLSLLLVITFIFGLVVGYLFSVLTNLRLRGKLFSSNRKLKKAEVA